MPIGVDDLVLVTINSRYHGQRVMSTFGYAASVALAPHDPEPAIDALVTIIQGAGRLVEKYYDCCSDGVIAEKVWAQLVRPTRLAKRTYVPAVATGSMAVTQDPVSNVAAVITRRGNDGRRSNVSVLHVPAPADEDIILEGELTAAYKTILDVLALELLTSYITFAGDIVWAPCIINSDIAENWSRITGTEVNGTARVMRRRTVGLGI